FPPTPRLTMQPSVPARGLLALIRLYQLTLAPLTGQSCRYLPTCSAYAAESVRAHGAWAGGWMAAARVCRCHPLAWRGYDPAPTQRAAWFTPWRNGDWSWRDRHPPIPTKS